MLSSTLIRKLLFWLAGGRSDIWSMSFLLLDLDSEGGAKFGMLPSIGVRFDFEPSLPLLPSKDVPLKRLESILAGEDGRGIFSFGCSLRTT